jgi:photosystem II stability/assembly factor-like uncharacterized protein
MIARVADRGATVGLSLHQVTGTTRPRPGRSKALYVPLAGVVTIAAAVALVLLLVAGSATQPPAAPSRSAGSTSLRMELVDSTSSPFQSVGGGPQTGDLLCVTASTCYASDSGPGGPGWEATNNGGVSWHALAPLPGGGSLSDPVSCPTTTTCIGGDGSAVLGGVAPSQGPELAWTSDAGRNWRLDSLPVPAGAAQSSVERLSCPTASDCIAFLTDLGAGSSATSSSTNFFMTTTDGGSTWTSSAAPVGLTGLWTLRCDADGDCVGLVPAGSVQDPSAEGIVAIRSNDWGRSWTTTSSPMPFGAGILLMECGDTLHCIMAFPADEGTTFDLARTSDGGQTWTTGAAPSGWPAIAISLSCADGEDCYLSASDSTRSGYASPALEVTHDGGGSWTPLVLPDVGGQPLALVYPLSCPVAAGCIGVGATPEEFNPPSRLGAPPNPSTPRSPNKNRVIISNLAPGGSS